MFNKYVWLVNNSHPYIIISLVLLCKIKFLLCATSNIFLHLIKWDAAWRIWVQLCSAQFSSVQFCVIMFSSVKYCKVHCSSVQYCEDHCSSVQLSWVQWGKTDFYTDGGAASYQHAFGKEEMDKLVHQLNKTHDI